MKKRGREQEKESKRTSESEKGQRELRGGRRRVGKDGMSELQCV